MSHDDQRIELAAKRMQLGATAIRAAASQLQAGNSRELARLAKDAHAEAERVTQLWESVERCAA